METNEAKPLSAENNETGPYTGEDCPWCGRNRVERIGEEWHNAFRCEKCEQVWGGYALLDLRAKLEAAEKENVASRSEWVGLRAQLEAAEKRISELAGVSGALDSCMASLDHERKQRKKAEKRADEAEEEKALALGLKKHAEADLTAVRHQLGATQDATVVQADELRELRADLAAANKRADEAWENGRDYAVGILRDACMAQSVSPEAMAAWTTETERLFGMDYDPYKSAREGDALRAKKAESDLAAARSQAEQAKRFLAQVIEDGTYRDDPEDWTTGIPKRLRQQREKIAGDEWVSAFALREAGHPGLDGRREDASERVRRLADEHEKQRERIAELEKTVEVMSGGPEAVALPERTPEREARIEAIREVVLNPKATLRSIEQGTRDANIIKGLRGDLLTRDERIKDKDLRITDLKAELEKAMHSARQYCGAHIGLAFDECPRCWGERQGEKAQAFQKELAAIQSENAKLKQALSFAEERRSSEEKMSSAVVVVQKERITALESENAKLLRRWQEEESEDDWGNEYAAVVTFKNQRNDLRELCGEMRDAMQVVQRSRKASIGEIDSHYSAQVFRKPWDALLAKAEEVLDARA